MQDIIIIIINCINCYYCVFQTVPLARSPIFKYLLYKNITNFHYVQTLHYTMYRLKTLQKMAGHGKPKATKKTPNVENMKRNLNTAHFIKITLTTNNLFCLQISNSTDLIGNLSQMTSFLRHILHIYTYDTGSGQ